MKAHERSTDTRGTVDLDRRLLLGAIGGSAVTVLLGGRMSAASTPGDGYSLRWGIVGTGGIADAMAPRIRAAAAAELAAVSSRRMASAREFAKEHGAAHAFDSWEEMVASDAIDAVYVATPTSVREQISIAAAENGKHVLGEKPFASLESLKRITGACRANDVGFMDGTHFVHHPRTAEIRSRTPELTGEPWSLASAFQVPLTDRDNIRYDPRLEPMGAIGDLGWYNMRAAVEYLSPEAGIADVCTYLRRDPRTGAAISGSGTIRFDDGSTTTWNAGFDSGGVVMDLRLTGPDGVIAMDDFVANDADGSASYALKQGGFGGDRRSESITVSSPAHAAQLMFEDFAAMVADAKYRERSIAASERTQALLDAAWKSALANERR